MPPRGAEEAQLRQPGQGSSPSEWGPAVAGGSLPRRVWAGGSCCTARHRCPPYARPGSPLQGAQARGRAWRVAPGGEGGCRPPPLPPPPRSGHRVTGCPCTAGVPSAVGALEPGGPRQGRGCAIWEASGSRDPTLNRGRADLLGARTREAGQGSPLLPVCRRGGHGGRGSFHQELTPPCCPPAPKACGRDILSQGWEARAPFCGGEGSASQQSPHQSRALGAQQPRSAPRGKGSAQLPAGAGRGGS